MRIFPGTARMASEAMLDWLQQIDGYRGLLALVDEESGSACFVTFWENEEAVVKTRASRSSLRDQMAATAGRRGRRLRGVHRGLLRPGRLTPRKEPQSLRS